jgi:hypothetical protein
MDSKIVVVRKVKTVKEKSIPFVNLIGKWLKEFGFEANKLVEIKCSKNNILLKLYEENTINHLEMSKRLFKTGNDSIIYVVNVWRKNKEHSPSIALKGSWLEDFGFAIGEVVATKCEYGSINLYRLDL